MRTIEATNQEVRNVLARATALACVLAFIFTGDAHAVKYKGWTVPDRFCYEHAYGEWRLHCIKAQRVVYTIFPPSTRHAAMLVVKCETGQRFLRGSTNQSSRTAGLFQIHPGNHGTTWHWSGHGAVTIDRGRLYNSWYNAKVALYMSLGGTTWGGSGRWAPVCQPY